MYIRRPLCLISAAFALILFIIISFFHPSLSKSSLEADGSIITACGKVKKKDIKGDKLRLFLDNGIIAELDNAEYDFTDVKVGGSVRFTGKFSVFDEPENEGQFDTRKYYLIRGYEGTLRNAKVLGISGKYSRYKEFLSVCRLKAEGVFDAYMDEKDAGVMKALLLGDKNDLDADTKDLYQNAGISHILSLSGLHIAAVGLCLLKLLRKTGLPFWFTCVISIAVMFSYATLTGMSLSTIRALIMFCLALIGEGLSRSYDLLTAAALSSVIILMMNPYYVTDSGFLLSFGAIIAIGCVYPAFSGMLDKGEPYKAFREEKDITAKIRKVGKNCIDGVIVSLSVTVTTLPVMACSYFKISRYSFLANIVVIPLMGVLLSVGFAALFMGMLKYMNFLASIGWAGAVSAGAAGGTLKIASAILRLYDAVAEKTGGLYGNILVTGKPKPIQVIIYYVFLVLAVTAGYFRQNNLHNTEFFDRNGLHNVNNSTCNLRQKHNKITVLRLSGENQLKKSVKGRKIGINSGISLKDPMAFGRVMNRLIVVMLTISSVILTKNNYENLEIRNISVGQGDCSAIFGRDTPVIVIDGGSTDVKNVGKYRIIPALLSNGVSEIDYMFITHLDADHYSGLLEILADTDCGISVKRLILSGAYMYTDSDEELSKLKELKEVCNAGNIPIFTISAGDVLNLGNITLTCLWPKITDDIELDANEKSIVLRLDAKEEKFSALFTGDIGEESEKNMLGMYENGKITCATNAPEQSADMDLADDILNCDYLKVAHHGSSFSSCSDFLSHVSPAISVISVGEGNSYGHPHAETLKRLNDESITRGTNRIYRTDETGETILRLDNDKAYMETWSPKNGIYGRINGRM